MKLKDSLIIILAVIIAIGAGVFIGVKLTENKNDNPTTNNGTTNNNENTNNGDVEIKKDFSIAEAEKLMEKYEVYGYCGANYIQDLNNSINIKELSRRNVTTSGYLSHEEVSKTNAYKEASEYIFAHDKYDYYDYNDVLNSAKKLFGPNATINKTNDFNDAGCSWYYLEEYDKFVEFELGFGGDCIVTDYSLTVDNFKFEDNQLKIYTTYRLGNTRNKNEYIFKLHNGNYYLAEINKLN